MYACSNLYGGVGVSKVCRAAHTDSLATHDLGVVGVERTVSHAQTKQRYPEDPVPDHRGPWQGMHCPLIFCMRFGCGVERAKTKVRAHTTES